MKGTQEKCGCCGLRRKTTYTHVNTVLVCGDGTHVTHGYQVMMLCKFCWDRCRSSANVPVVRDLAQFDARLKRLEKRGSK